MQVPQKKKRDIREILREFQRIDQIYFDFEAEFQTNVSLIISDFAPEFFLTNPLDYELKHFANQIFNMAESVIDKDKSYPPYRIKEELKRLQELSRIQVNYDFPQNMVNQLKNTIKKITVDYFSGIYELSAEGFLLLEANVIYNTNVFLDWLELQIEYADE